jgi:hypothetical protein
MSGKRCLCDECSATSDKTSKRLRIPVSHRPGQLIWRFHIRHEADCPYVARESSGISPWPHGLTGVQSPNFDTVPAICDGCTPIMWWDKIGGDVIRIELYHADDCSARAASELAAEGR